jgi:hypothetical protein
VRAPNAKYRKLVVPRRWTKKNRKHTTHSALSLAESEVPLAPLSWAERLKRMFKIDIELCPRCGGKLRVIATITQPDVIQKILDHAHQQQAPPRKPPDRASGPINTRIQFDAV